MKDYILIDVETDISKENILQHVVNTLPEYKWRTGDSDAAGPYVSGINKENVDVKFWIGEEPMEIAVSFTSYKESLPKREKGKKEHLDKVIASISPHLGRIIRKDL